MRAYESLFGDDEQPRATQVLVALGTQVVMCEYAAGRIAERLSACELELSVWLEEAQARGSALFLAL